MRPYGERPTGKACNCCNVLRGGEDGHKRTAERMAAREDALKDMARHEMELAEDRYQAKLGNAAQNAATCAQGGAEVAQNDAEHEAKVVERIGAR